jgi:hypothetical protein
MAGWTMGRRPLGERAMTSSERQARFIAKREAQARREAMQGAPALSGPIVQVRHMKDWPHETSIWLAARLGSAATAALIEALGKAIEIPTAKEEAPPGKESTPAGASSLPAAADHPRAGMPQGVRILPAVPYRSVRGDLTPRT